MENERKAVGIHLTVRCAFEGNVIDVMEVILECPSTISHNIVSQYVNTNLHVSSSANRNATWHQGDGPNTLETHPFGSIVFCLFLSIFHIKRRWWGDWLIFLCFPIIYCLEFIGSSKCLESVTTFHDCHLPSNPLLPPTCQHSNRNNNSFCRVRS